MECYLFEAYDLWTGVFDLHSEIKFGFSCVSASEQDSCMRVVSVHAVGWRSVDVRDTMHLWT